MKSGVEFIAIERERQINEEGRSLEGDDQHKPGALTMAAICYATVAASGPAVRAKFRKFALGGTGLPYWPWSPEWFKPGAHDTEADRIRELTKAGALIAAEIDRLQRKSN